MDRRTTPGPELDEPAIRRYSRQILLAEVGGVGQVNLRAQRFRLTGQGTALTTAAAYLAGAGCALEGAPRPVASAEVGYLIAADQVGASLSDVLDGALPPAACGDAPEAPIGILGEVPGDLDASGPRVAMGRLAREGSLGAVAYSASGACVDCFEVALAHLEAGLAGADAVAVGSVAALVAQHLVLDLDVGVGVGVGVVAVAPQGPMNEEVERCSRCR